MMDHKLSAKILEKKGPGWTVVSIEYASATNKGDGNASQMVRATVHLQSGNLRETLTLILKKQPESKAFSEFLNQFSVFQTEINVYTLVISQMEELMAEYSDQRGPLWCKFWGHDGNEFLILEDLKEQSFVMTDRHSGLDRDRAMLAIRGLARFHAMSSVLVDRGRLDPAKFADYPYLQNSESFNNYFKGAIDTLLSVIRSRWEPKWRPIADRIEDCTRDFGPKLMQLGKLQDGAFNVLIHGDCWINNMMFKYPQGSTVPKELRFVDFQVCHYNSYGWDIVNLLHSSMLPDVRRSALREMVGAYRDTLLETFKTFGHPADIVPTEVDIVLEIRRLNFASFLVCCSHLPATLSPPGQGLDMEAIGQDSSTTVFHNAAMYTIEIYDRAIKDDIERFMGEGLF